MSEEILPHIYRIPVALKGNPLRELNSYLIRGKDRDLLIDTGFRQESCREALTAGLQELGVCRDNTDVLLTHMHSDHSGLAPEYVGKDRNIFISAIDRAYLDFGTRRELWMLGDGRYAAAAFPRHLLEELSVSVPSRLMSAPQYDGYQDLYDGDVLEVGDYKLTAVLTPGHTPGHMCYWLEEQGIMFTGDHVLFDITPNITSWPKVKNSLGSYLESLKAIQKYDVKLALPGHRATGDFKTRIDALLCHHDDRLLECLDVVRNRPGMTVYEIASHMTWKIRADSWESFPNNQKWFAVGECMSHLDYLLEDGRVRRVRDGAVDRYFITD